MSRHITIHLPILLLLSIPATAAAETAAEPYLGSWAFELPDGNPAWFRLEQDADKLQGALLWSVGSARPVQQITLKDGRLRFRRKIRWRPFGNAEDLKEITDPFVGKLVDGRLQLTAVQSSAGHNQPETLVLTGSRMPEIPAPPDLSRVTFGPAISLLNGEDLSGWRLSNLNKKNGWRVEAGVLINETPKTDFGAYGDYGNLRTDEEFEDFRLTIEYNVPAGGNSGIYLRGMYEAQVVDRDSSMQGIGGPGAIYGRLAPRANTAKPGGQWNRYVLTLVQRHITVTLNGTIVIDNQPVIGCTGGGLSADDTKPGPILLQGDHTSVRYRNIELSPVTN